MSKTTKVLEIKDYPHLVCVRHNGSVNPYRLYLFYPGKDKFGYSTEHKKQLAAYADIHSVICHINDMYKADVQYKTADMILVWNKQYYRPV